MKFFAPILSLCLLAGPVCAAESAWQSVAPDVSVRLVGNGEVGADGTTLVGVEIRMPQNTHTYWRVPGETGLAPSFALDAASGMSVAKVHWPHPEIASDTGYIDYVYRGDTVLPLTLAVTDATAPVAMSVVLGICAEVCVPVQAELEMPIGDADPGNALRLRQAVSAAPLDWPGDTPPVGGLEYDDAGQALRLKLLDPDIDATSLIAVIDEGAPLLGPGEADVNAAGDIAFPLLEAADDGVAGREVSFDFMTSDGAYRYVARIPSP